MWETDLKQRAFDFAYATLQLHPRIARLGPPYAHIAQQLFEAASAVGALLEESDATGSRKDMGWKHVIARREAKESGYWLRLLIRAEVLVPELRPLFLESGEFVAMLTASIAKLRPPPEE